MVEPLGARDRPTSAEMHPGPGFRVRASFERVDPEVVDGFRAFETPSVSDLMNRLYTMDPGIRLLTPIDGPLVGCACTVKVFPGDNLMVHKSLDVAQPGDVIVVDAAGSTTNAALGDMISMKARHRGVAGFVVDGLVRDLPGILGLGDVTVFARGVTPLGPLHRGPGEVGYPVSVGRIVVRPGDVIVGDENGVVVVPREVAPELLERLRDKHDAEASYAEAVSRGEFSNAWVDETLRAGGAELDG
jgi:regulator of RNase E activity RraA